jgi:hypothetical protein
MQCKQIWLNSECQLSKSIRCEYLTNSNEFFQHLSEFLFGASPPSIGKLQNSTKLNASWILMSDKSAEPLNFWQIEPFQLKIDICNGLRTFGSAPALLGGCPYPPAESIFLMHYLLGSNAVRTGVRAQRREWRGARRRGGGRGGSTTRAA